MQNISAAAPANRMAISIKQKVPSNKRDFDYGNIKMSCQNATAFSTSSTIWVDVSRLASIRAKSPVRPTRTARVGSAGSQSSKGRSSFELRENCRLEPQRSAVGRYREPGLLLLIEPDRRRGCTTLYDHPVSKGGRNRVDEVRVEDGRLRGKHEASPSGEGPYREV